MAKANINDRATLERTYPADALAGDAAWNERPDAVQRGVRIGSAPDADGWFELECATRHAGEPETPYFLTPAQGVGHARFLDDIVATAKRFGFRAEDTPASDDPRLKGFRGG